VVGDGCKIVTVHEFTSVNLTLWEKLSLKYDWKPDTFHKQYQKHYQFTVYYRHID